jgi:hypothetical protein
MQTNVSWEHPQRNLDRTGTNNYVRSFILPLQEYGVILGTNGNMTVPELTFQRPRLWPRH